MSEYLSEQEQVERIKKFLKTHGSNILTGILIALTAYFGFQYMQKRDAVSQIEASAQFQELEQAQTKLTTTSKEGDKTAFYAQVKKLVDAHPKSIYAMQALLLQAQQYATDNKLAEAENTYVQAAALPIKDAGMVAIANLRLAQTQLAQNKAKEALTTLAKVTLPFFSASKDELTGDAYVALKDNDNAKTAYEQAWKVLQERNEPRPILRLKMEELGMKPATIKPVQVLKDAAIS